MTKGEAKVIDPKSFLYDPIAFGFLMDFQYGDAEESSKAEEVLFSSSVDGVVVKNVEEMGIVLHGLDFWIEMAGKWQEKQKSSLRLYANNGIDSRIAAKYLEQDKFKFEVINVGRARIPVHDTMTSLPVLVDLKTGYAYSSLPGVKKFIRHEILGRRGINIHEYACTDKLKFFVDWDYSAKPAKITHIVTCFDSRGRKVYTGDIEKAPHPIKKHIDDYDYQDWHEVGSWEIGKWQKLLSSRSRNERVVNLETRTVLFPDDIELLKQEKVVVINEVRHFMQVTYEAYFRDKEKLYRLYADMLD